MTGMRRKGPLLMVKLAFQDAQARVRQLARVPAAQQFLPLRVNDLAPRPRRGVVATPKSATAPPNETPSLSTAAPTATVSMVSAVASFSSPSPSMIVTRRGGSRDPLDPPPHRVDQPGQGQHGSGG